MPISITPRVTVPVQTPLGRVYVGASARRTNRAPQGAPVARATRTMRPAVAQRATQRPTLGTYVVAIVAILVGGFLALVAMALLAMAAGVLPAAPATTTPTPAPTQSVASTSTAPGPGVWARSSTGR
jgi:hypothetical protein